VTRAVRGLPGPRAVQAARRDVPFLAVLVLLVAGFAFIRIQPEHWLRGVLVIGADLIVAGLLRLFLRTRRAGLLAVRSRLFDTVAYTGLGVLVITFGLLLPR
jgi:Protein of unknown function (DUF3017)